MAKMSLDTAIRLSAEVKGGGNIDRVKRSLQDLGKNSQLSARQMNSLRSATFQFARANNNTIAGIKNSIAAFRGLQEQAKIGSREFQRYGAEIQKLEAKLNGLDGTAQRAGQSLSQKLAAGLAAAGIGRALQQITVQAGKFDAELRKAAAIEGSAGSFEVLRKEIEAVASTAAGTPTEVAALATALSRAGFSADQTAKALRGIVQGAEATDTAFADMGGIVGTILKTFQVDASQTSGIVDVLVKSANSANQTVIDVGEAMSYAAGQAATLGVDIKDTSALIALLADAGARGSRGGTAIATGLSRLQIAAGGADSEMQELIKGSAKMAEAMTRLGASILDAEGDLKPMDEVLVAIKRQMDGMSATDKAIIAKALFGADSGKAFQALLARSEQDIVSMFSKMRNAGGVAADTQQKMQGFDYSIKVLGGNIENVTNQIGGMVGKALKPFIDFLNELLGLLNAAPDPIKQFGAAAAAAGVATLGFVAAANALKMGLAALGGISAVTSALNGYTGAATAAGNASTVAAGKVGLLKTALATLAKIGIITVGINLVVNGLTNAIRANQEIAKLRGERNAGGAAAMYGGAAPKAAKAAAQQTLNAIEAERKRGVSLTTRLLGPLAGLVGAPTPADAIDRSNVLRARERAARATLALPTRQDVSQPVVKKRNLRQPDPIVDQPDNRNSSRSSGGSSSAEDKAARDAERAAEKLREQQQAATNLLNTEKDRLLIAETAGDFQRQIVQSMTKEYEIQREYNDKLNQSKSAEETLNLQLAKQNALRTNGLDLQRAMSSELDSITQPLDSMIESSRQRLELEMRHQKLLADGVNPELAKEFAQLEITAEKQKELLTLRAAELEAAKAKLSAESDVAKAIQEQIDKIKELLGLLDQSVDKSKKETEEERKKREEREEREAKAKESAQRLNDLYGGIVSTIEDGIVGALQAGIDGLIDGTKSLDQALSDILRGVLQEISNMLLKFIVNTAMRALFPGAFADGGVFTQAGLAPYAKGGSFNAGQVQPFASGGIVDSPTLFKFANGGAMRTGVMGEAGPEAILPLKRGANGQLGVQMVGPAQQFAANRAALDGSTTGSSTSSPLAESRQALATAETSIRNRQADRSIEQAFSAPGQALKIQYDSQVINNVEYVTSDQFQRGMSQAAERGRALTLGALKNSVKARRQVGI
jgi:TP901 family phage tail tape measure protein